MQCLKILNHIGLTEKIEIDSDVNVLGFKINLSFLSTIRHVPPTTPTNDLNISSVEVCQFKKTQRLAMEGGCNKFMR